MQEKIYKHIWISNNQLTKYWKPNDEYKKMNLIKQYTTQCIIKVYHKKYTTINVV